MQRDRVATEAAADPVGSGHGVPPKASDAFQWHVRNGTIAFIAGFVKKPANISHYKREAGTEGSLQGGSDGELVGAAVFLDEQCVPHGYLLVGGCGDMRGLSTGPLHATGKLL